MGERDIVALNKIYRFSNDFCKLSGIPFHFEEDSGNYQTAIVFDEEEISFRLPETHENWDNVHHPQTMVCCDILDFSHKIIMEYEEEGQKHLSGARLARKGHGPEGDIPNRRDTKRNEFYANNEFSFLRIWEAQFKVEIIWKIKVIEFILVCYTEFLENKS